jgi:hypothetical protein
MSRGRNLNYRPSGGRGKSGEMLWLRSYADTYR